MIEILADAVSPVVLGGAALGLVIFIAIVVFIILSIVAFVRKKYRQKETNDNSI